MFVNTAQKVRLWFNLGLSILNVLSVIAVGALPGYELEQGAGHFWYTCLFFSVVANIAVGSVAVYRFLHPLPPKQFPAHAWQPQPPYPPQQAPYPQPPQQPPAGDNWFR